MFADLTKTSKIKHFCEDYDHSCSSLYYNHLVRTAIIVVVLRNWSFLKRFALFEAITYGHFRLSSLMSALAFDTWAHILTLKKRGG